MFCKEYNNLRVSTHSGVDPGALSIKAERLFILSPFLASKRLSVCPIPNRSSTMGIKVCGLETCPRSDGFDLEVKGYEAEHQRLKVLYQIIEDT